jgi:hypothetical protein
LRNPLVEPITGGNITGSLFTGTIVCCSAVVTVTDQGKVTNPSVQIFGEAEGRSPFIATAHGVGEVGAHLARVASYSFSRVVIAYTDSITDREIGGKCA